MQAASARTCRRIYSPFSQRDGHVLLLSFSSDFALWVTLPALRGAERDAIRVRRVVVVRVAVVVHIAEVRRVGREGAAEPPVVGGACAGQFLQNITYVVLFGELFRSLLIGIHNAFYEIDLVFDHLHPLLYFAFVDVVEHFQ